MSPRLLFKLSTISVRRSWFLLGLMTLSFAQLLLVLWLAASVSTEISRTESYAKQARFVTVQLKEEIAGPEVVRNVFIADDVSIEELKVDQILERMEVEEPEVVQTIRALGPEGLQLVPKVMLIRGEFGAERIEKLKLLTEVSKVDVSPIHHARLLNFYRHLSSELKVGFAILLFLILVQLLVFQRIQQKDLQEVVRNLTSWGVSHGLSRLPGFVSLILLSFFAIGLSFAEWWVLLSQYWRNNAFLGELSMQRSLSFPVPFVGLVILFIAATSVILSFSGRGGEEA